MYGAFVLLKHDSTSYRWIKSHLQPNLTTCIPLRSRKVPRAEANLPSSSGSTSAVPARLPGQIHVELSLPQKTNLNSLLVHARLENRLGHLERLWIAGFDLSFEESPHLHIQLVPKDGEHRGSCSIVRNDGLLYEAATGKLVEVVAWVCCLVQLVQQVRSGLDASL